MTTDRDMERARETLDATYDELPLFTRAVTKAQETAAANIIAAALAAERAPLEARIAELAKLLAEARAALRDLLAGLSLDDAPRRAAIDRARETVRRWDAGEPQRPVAWIEEERAPHAVGDRVRANLDGVWHAGDVLGVENIAGPGSPPRWRYLVRVDPGVGYLGNTVWAYTVERIDEEPQVTGHCPTCATVALERERAEGQREMLRAALRDEQTASHRELEELRAKLTEAEHERGLAIALMTEAGVEPVPDDCDGKLLGHVELMRQMWAADRAEIERLRAERNDAIRAAEDHIGAEGDEPRLELPPIVLGEPLIERGDLLTRADLDAFRGELVAAMREAFPIGTGYGDPPSITHGFHRFADKLETGR